MRRATLCFLACMVTAGCGDDAPGAVVVVRWSRSDVAARYCEPLVAARCEAAARCSCASACDATQAREQCLAMFSETSSRGATEFDGQRLTQLLELQRAYLATCTPPPDALGDQLAFAGVVLGVGIGEPCGPGGATPHACAGGAGVCIADATSPDGICRDLPAIGEPCLGVFGRCEYPALCSAGVCVAPVAGYSDACATDLGCAAPARCVGHSCRVLGATGATCAASEDCEPGNDCSGGTCTATLRCVSAAPCGYGTTCGDGGSGTCELIGGRGSACTSDGNCAPGFACALGTSTCQDAPAAGAPCSAGGRCATDARCEGGTCVRPPADGGPCDTVFCPPEYFCDAGTCALRLAEGAACPWSAHCRLGLACVDGLCVDPTGLACDVGTAGACGELHSCRASDRCVCDLVNPVAAETCNGIDDDRNGVVDDGLAPQTCGLGACATTAPSCAGGAPAPCPPPSATGLDTTCNGIDDDCDGATDIYPRDAAEWQGLRVELCMQQAYCEGYCGNMMACIDSQCVPCVLDADCLTGEVCVLDYCLLEASVTCRHAADCPSGLCVIQGGTVGEPRGNVGRRAYCIDSGPRG